MMMLHQIDVN